MGFHGTVLGFLAPPLFCCQEMIHIAHCLNSILIINSLFIQRWINEAYEECLEQFKCPGEGASVILDLLCDNIETCKTEGRVCNKYNSGQIMGSVIKQGDKVMTSYCLPGLERDPLLKCGYIDESYHPETNIAVTQPGVKYPLDVRMGIRGAKGRLSCAHFYGEQYVYLACNKICDAKCPLKPLKYNSCPSLRSKIFAPSPNGYLSFVKSDKGSYTNQMFPCDNGVCLTFDKVNKDLVGFTDLLN